MPLQVVVAIGNKTKAGFSLLAFGIALIVGYEKREDIQAGLEEIKRRAKH